MRPHTWEYSGLWCSLSVFLWALVMGTVDSGGVCSMDPCFGAWFVISMYWGPDLGPIPGVHSKTLGSNLRLC